MLQQGPICPVTNFTNGVCPVSIGMTHEYPLVHFDAIHLESIDNAIFQPQPPEHPGFVIGKILRYIFDSSLEAIQKCTKWLQSSRKSQTSFVPDINPTQSYLKDKEKCQETGCPQALILTTRNGGLSPALRYSDIVPALEYQSFMSYLSSKYQLHIKTISTNDGLCDMIHQTSELGPIQFFMLAGHGSSSMMRLNSDYSLTNRISPLHHFIEEVDEKVIDLSCLSLLSRDVQIILFGCSLGDDNLYDWDKTKSWKPLLINVHRQIAAHVPGATIFAADFISIKNTLSINFESTPWQVSAVGATGLSNKWLSDFMSIFGNCLSPNFAFRADYYYPCVVLQLPLFMYDVLFSRADHNLIKKSPFKIISPDHADFCKEVVSYYAMQRYCDNVGLRPSKQNMAACKSDRNCATTANHTQMITAKRIKKCD